MSSNVDKPCMYDKTCLICKPYMSWCWAYFFKHFNKPLDVNDLYKCPNSSSSKWLGNKLEKEWDKELTKVKLNKSPSLNLALCRVFGLRFISSLIILIFAQAILLLQTLCMGWMVRDLSLLPEALDREQVKTDIYLMAAGICLTQLIYILSMNPYWYSVSKLGMDMRIACCRLIYKKSLRLSNAAFAETTVGQIVNLLSNDVNRFDIGTLQACFLIVGPLQALAATYILWPTIGIWTLTAIGILLFYIPLQAVMGKMFSKIRAKTALLTDERVRLMNEFIPAMRVIKMYAWEKPFAKMVDTARRKEIKKITYSAILRGINLGMFFVSAKIIIFVMFLFYVLNGGPLSAEIVFVAMSLINQLRLSITLFIPYAIAFGSEMLISISRLKKFYLLPEQDERPQLTSSLKNATEADVTLNNVTCYWIRTMKKSNPTLKDLSFSVKGGELLVIVGPVGSGKSSTLMTILNELPVSSGYIRIRGKISYTSQEPWTFAGTVRENILFGNIYEEHKYKEVVKVCALERDLTLFEYGDKTFVGERGVSLSGGQRARINLARALYLDADIYLLDDPLSAVDAHVAKHIFNESIKKYLKNKIVILCTHQLQFIKDADKILLLKKGTSAAFGNYNELLNLGIDFLKFCGSLPTQSEENKLTKSRQLSRTSSIASDIIIPDTYGSSLSLSTSYHEDIDLGVVVGNKTPGPRESNEMAGDQGVSARIYWVYFRAGGGWFLLPTILISLIVTQILFTGSDWWLSLWTDTEERKFHARGLNITNLPSVTFVDDYTRNENVIIYTIQMTILFVLSLIRTIAYFMMCMRSSIKLHDRLFQSVTRAPISFFDKNPIGILLNRCSRDMGIVDDILPATKFDAISILATDIGIALLIGLLNYWIVIPTLVLIIIFYFVRKLYIGTARNIKKLEGVTKSPVFSHLSSSLYGLITIRAFNAQHRFESKFDIYQDDHSASWFMYIASSRWFIIALDYICVAYISAVAISLTMSIDSINGSTIGLAITSAVLLGGGFQWGIKQATEVETMMTSVERIDEYSKLPSEADLESQPDHKPPKEWPQNGKIIFKDLSLYYSESNQPVLKNLNFVVEAKQKIGVVGRTGAGKSSIIAALFRLTEPEGMIEIDGYDIKSIGLHDLRKKISIIPQEPVLFSGSLRSNLDPFNEIEDSKLWKALEEVQLKEVVEALSGGLLTTITEGGSNFSVGQRQLICLARAVIKENRILILDEATANVDPKTDALIQETIRDVFASCTILTIAHRLHTIMDSDKVLVLDAGQIIEFDDPLTLINKENGMFNSMVKATGKEMSENLRTMAKLAQESRASNYQRAKSLFTVTLKQLLDKSEKPMDIVEEVEKESDEVTKM